MNGPAPPATDARSASTPAPVGRAILTDEQRDILWEATAYRFIHYSAGVCRAVGGFELEIRANAPLNPNRKIWGPQILGTGTFDEMEQLRKAAMTEYKRLVKGVK